LEKATKLAEMAAKEGLKLIRFRVETHQFARIFGTGGKIFFPSLLKTKKSQLMRPEVS